MENPIRIEKRKPRTPLGERLSALRDQAISKGMELLSWEKVSEEVRQRRGERSEDRRKPRCIDNGRYSQRQT